jgi:hypothetical protein
MLLLEFRNVIRPDMKSALMHVEYYFTQCRHNKSATVVSVFIRDSCSRLTIYWLILSLFQHIIYEPLKILYQSIVY